MPTRIEVNVITGEITEHELTVEEIAALPISEPTEPILQIPQLNINQIITELKALVDAQAVTLATQATEIAELKAKVGA